MRRTCFEMMREIGYEIGLLPDLSITSFTDTALRTQLLMYLNRAKTTISQRVPLNTLRTEVPFDTIDSYSTGTISIVANDTTITGVGTTFTALMVGRKIRIGTDLASYEIIRFTNATHIEIDRPFPFSAQSGVAYTIFQDIYELSPRLSTTIMLKRPGVNRPIPKVPIGYLETRWPDPLQGTGDIRMFSDFGEKKTTESSLTLAAGSSTISAVYATLAYVGIENYYVDWYLYNETRGMGSRITAYTASSTTLTLERAITGQVATDVVSLYKRSMLIKLRPTPLSDYQLIAVGTRDATLFVNDYDYEYEIDGGVEDILIYQAIADYYKPRDEKRAGIFQAQADALYDIIRDQNSDLGVGQLCFTGGSGAGVVNDPYYSTFSRTEPY